MSVSSYVDDIKKGWKTAECGSHVEDMDGTCGSRRTNNHFLTMFIWVALNVNVNRTKLLLINRETCSNHEFLLERTENSPV